MTDIAPSCPDADIATLISSLKFSCHKIITTAEHGGGTVELLAVQMTRGNLNRIIDALSSLAAPPPEEIAGVAREMLTALRSLAQEVERLKGIESDYLRRHKDACDRWERIRELEAECNEWQQRANNAAELLELRTTAIRNKTIEECVDACYNKLSEIEAMQAEGAIRTSTKIGVSNGT